MSWECAVEGIGPWFDLSTWDLGYARAVQAIDLGVAAGFTGAFLVEHWVVLCLKDGQRVKRALEVCHHKDMSDCDEHWFRLQAVMAMLMFGPRDTDDSWNNYVLPYAVTVQTNQGGLMEFGGLKADLRLEGITLREYIESVHLK